MDVEWRSIADTDVSAWCSLLAAAERVDQTGENANEADLVEELADPALNRARDTLSARVDGMMVGYGSVHAGDTADTEHRVHFNATVHPDWRGQGIGRHLLDWAVRRAHERHQEMFPDVPPAIESMALLSNAAQVELFEAVGMQPQRWFFGMAIRLTGEAHSGDIELPDGFTLQQYDHSQTEATRLAHNSAFADHWGSTEWTPQRWQQWVTDARSTRPDLSSTVTLRDAPEQVVAYLISKEYEADFEATGVREAYVEKVGTRREHRGRGLASALLGHSLAAYGQAGFDVASLDVDADNPTGALGIYQRQGFEVEHRWARYVLA
ncbi:MAG: GNAT family N-acetyltransferase [Nocardioidaceae bacterium]